jgi:hypothetical protein
MEPSHLALEHRVGLWLLRVSEAEDGLVSYIAIEGSWDEVERLAQRIWWTHRVVVRPLSRLSPEEFWKRFPAVLTEEPD